MPITHLLDTSVYSQPIRIAATALVHGLTLATCNVRPFEGIEGLPVEDWSRDT